MREQRAGGRQARDAFATVRCVVAVSILAAVSALLYSGHNRRTPRKSEPVLERPRGGPETRTSRLGKDAIDAVLPNSRQKFLIAEFAGDRSA